MNELTQFNEGGSHETNPLGGVPQGQNQQGSPNLVEEGETKFNNYIYSNRLMLNKDVIEAYNLPKSLLNKSFADASKNINNKFKEREDNISNRTKKGLLDKLSQAQEELKAQEQALLNQSMSNNSSFMEEGIDPQMFNFGGMMGQMGGMFGNIGSSLPKNDGLNGYTDSQLEKEKALNQTADGVKDGVASAFGPIGQMFRGIQKAGQGIGNAIGGDGGAVVSGLFSPEEGTISAWTDKDTNIGEKLLGTVPGLGQVMANRRAQDRMREAQANAELKASNMLTSDFKYGGKLKNKYPDGGLLNLTKNSDPNEIKRFQNWYDTNYEGTTGVVPGWGPKTQKAYDSHSGLYNLTQNHNLVNPINIDKNEPVKVDPRYNPGYDPSNDPILKNMNFASNKGLYPAENGEDNPYDRNEYSQAKNKKTSKKTNWDEVNKYGSTAMMLAPAIANLTQKVPKPEVVQPVINNTRFNPSYFDLQGNLNQVNDVHNASIRGINEMGASTGAMRNSILGANLNRFRAMSDVYQQNRLNNINQNFQGQQFNNSINEANIGRRTIANEQNEMNRANYRKTKSDKRQAIAKNIADVGMYMRNAQLIRDGYGYNQWGQYQNQNQNRNNN